MMNCAIFLWRIPDIFFAAVASGVEAVAHAKTRRREANPAIFAFFAASREPWLVSARVDAYKELLCLSRIHAIEAQF